NDSVDRKWGYRSAYRRGHLDSATNETRRAPFEERGDALAMVPGGKAHCYRPPVALQVFYRTPLQAVIYKLLDERSR
ncbi:MAG TPA: hypothetical protein VLL25_12985, partial [Acidimicrobiales bacterium]|nr:hypothetical protein [Acidimicrobiales bacterium]